MPSPTPAVHTLEYYPVARGAARNVLRCQEPRKRKVRDRDNSATVTAGSTQLLLLGQAMRPGGAVNVFDARYTGNIDPQACRYQSGIKPRP